VFKRFEVTAVLSSAISIYILSIVKRQSVAFNQST